MDQRTDEQAIAYTLRPSVPKDPKGRKRPADVISNAVTVMRIATGDIDEPKRESALAERGRRGGLKGGTARAGALSSRRRRQIARKAAEARWSGRKKGA